MVNCHQSLAFDYPSLLCNDHCEQWLFKEIVFYYFQNSHMQMFFKTGVMRNFAIFTENICVNKLYFNLAPKETSTQLIPVEIAKVLRTTFFMEHIQWLLLSV